jgi:very-short-patch-repair endonuclease
MGRGFAGVTTIKPPLPTDTLHNARRLRREMTDAERRLWQHLRAGRFDGLKFRRQHPVPPYVADFCCVSVRLIVELDGSQHCEEIDTARTRYLGSQGWRVMRFWNNDVLLQTEAVLDAIWNAINDRTLSPTPLPMEEGLKSA